MRVVVAVPRRADGGHRDRLWSLCRARWQHQHADWPIHEGHHAASEGPFSRSAAINRAVAAAGAFDVAVVIDADTFQPPLQVRMAVEMAADTGRVVWAHRRWRGLTEQATVRLMTDTGYQQSVFGGATFTEWDGGQAAQAAAIHGLRSPDAIQRALLRVPRDMVDAVVDKTTPLSWSCCIAIPAAAWHRLGGFDERFAGWGFEDMAFQSAACSVIGHDRVEGDVYHLWHPRTPGAGAAGRAAGGAYSAAAITNARLGRRYMVAARRDHGIHDRSAPADGDEMARDIANLVADDARLATAARLAGLPDWSAWWPTLDELLAGAAAARGQPATIAHKRAERPRRPGRTVDRTTTPAAEPAPATVTIAVHTDGRREYVAEAMDSLMANVSGQVVRRVLFDDSGSDEYKAWLTDRYQRHGWYVVGPSVRVGYTRSMRALWRYLATRCNSRFVFLAEDDFVYRRPVDLDALAALLDAQPHLRQAALLRAPYYPDEIAAGGIVQQRPDAYTMRTADGMTWLEHRLFFTANPSLFRRSLTKTAWPLGASSERRYTDLLNRDRASRFAFVGDGTPWIDHVGAHRAGHGY